MNTFLRSLILGSIVLLPALLCGISARADTMLAQAPPTQGKAAPAIPPTSAAEKGDLFALFPPPAVSRQSTGEGAAKLSYTATAATLALPGPKGTAGANIFHVAYTLEESNARRPITFVFNGGPGAAAAYLHLGAMGPRVVNFEVNGAAPIAPVALADNPDTWLGFTDLVFVDPVATGYSRSTAGTEEGDRAYFGVEKDRDAMADFVRLYLTRAGRLLAPVFLVGESYGGFRAGLVAAKLLSGGIGVKGVVLVSPALEFSMLRHNPYMLLPQALVLPSIAATHLELRDGPQGSLDILPEVERFAREKYLVHMAAGLRNDPDVEVALARYTGLPADVIRSHFGRVTVRTFVREHQTRRDRVLSRYDGVVSAAVPRRSERHFDPILDGATAVLAPAFTQYARGELGYRTDLTYELLNRGVSGIWDYGTSPTRQGFAGALDELQKARTHSPGLGVLITHGYTDLVTPYFVSRYLIDQLAPIDTARPIGLKVYRGGHMMYLRPASRAALTQDVRAFYEQLSKPPSKGP